MFLNQAQGSDLRYQSLKHAPPGLSRNLSTRNSLNTLKALMLQRQMQSILPIQTHPSRWRNRPISQLLRELKSAHHCQDDR